MIVVGGAQLERHLLAAVRAHVRRLRLEGMAVPPALVELSIELRACTGLDGSDVAADADPGDGSPMALTMDFREAGQMIGVSESSVKRLVSEGKLPSVNIGRSRRIRGEDVRRFVADLPTTKGKK